MRILLFLIGFLFLGGATAVAADVLPAAAYFPVLPFDAPADATPRWVPVAANQAMEGPHSGVTRAIVVIHDETRDANAALSALSALAGAANQTTMIVAPQFLLDSDVARFADHLPEKGRAFATWPFAAWINGDDSAPAPGQKNISSFTVIDLLLMYLSDRNAFPDLQTIVIAGYGAGAAFTQRYAAFGVAADAVAQQNIDLRYILAATPSYLYLTVSRPLGGRKGFRPGDSAACPDYNAYPYGLDRLNAYARHIGGNAAKTDYALRFVTYLNGKGGAVFPDTSCAALAQGGDSIARAANYAQYLQSLYGDVAGRTQTFSQVKDGKNDAIGLFGSPCGMATLFGGGLCVPSFGDNP